MGDRRRRNTLLGFTLAAAGFGAVDGYLIGDPVTGALAGGLLGAFLGAGIVLLAWRHRPQDAGSPPALRSHHTNYLAVWGALFVLTALEVSVAFLALAKLAIVLALVALAVWKALLVALYYMHLRFEPRRMWLLAASPLPLALILVGVVLFEGW